MDKPLTGHLRADREPVDLAGYEKAGGYAALRKALGSMSPKEVQGVVKDSGLRGRGGAGFPTGQKWSFVPIGQGSPRPKYLLANADEMEPGTFKDRLLLEGDPHLLLEGMILAAFAIEAETAYLFLRWEYKRAEKVLERAIAEARDAGYIGGNVLGSGFSVDLRLHVSGGRYMCGEETALMNALEGKRAIPRAKPPFPPVVGLFGKPTVVNNVETLCNVPHIVERGAQWFKDLSRTAVSGTKLFGMSGPVKRPGLWELPMGTTLRELLEEHAGGMREGSRFRGALPGGASTAFLTEEHLDVALDFESVQNAGSRLGTGTAIVLDDRTCPVGMMRNLEHFFAQESCGWCTPCREGLPWTERILGALEDGEGREGDIERLQMNVSLIGPPGRTFCALAPGAMDPLGSAIKYFRDDFQKHIAERRCAYKS